MEFSNDLPVPARFGNRWGDVRVVVTDSEITATAVANEDELDGVTVLTGDRFLYAVAGAAAGIYVVGASNSARAADADAAGEFGYGKTVRVREGSMDSRGHWTLQTRGAITLGTTSLSFTRGSAVAEDLGFGSFTSTPPAPEDL